MPKGLVEPVKEAETPEVPFGPDLSHVPFGSTQRGRSEHRYGLSLVTLGQVALLSDQF